MTTKVILITGASDGIGAAAARALQADGHTVVLIGRSPTKTEAVASELHADSFLADFADLDQVRRLAAELKEQYPRIDVLANNAGGIFDQQRTVDGFERTLQINHLAPFLLTNLLMETLLASQASVVNTSSAAAKLFGNINIDDLSNDNNYSPNKAYGDAKLGNILFTKELHRRYHSQGLSAAAFHPGIVSTNFAHDTSSPMRIIYQSPLRRLMRMTSPEKGADTLVWLTEGIPGDDWESGEYYVKRKPAKTNAQASDAALAERHWNISAKMVGLD
ncbi:short-chain dehydrogenase [Microbacterium sp. CH12i]|uniref:SDR family NAD(P)-dependent oxidoreductase n=1 Tax=Microbacterium sp. CH12i TaxID=1479651 RepID=UPI000460E230|nr:SDR family NAD(P)-dependent oxidoreductase [Microbacterium sp. CH12i]KDA04991.1 short-chain dehydrogenase [Microbacterium sp. CH12i]